ncbi:hypothetical protein HK099_008092 [Clydaea vesicula]|uniref:Uncharacterized protein n=1 Tax=Clydaea vesicula TaxID=447962 RepID=A0AAD5TVQ8_9FUNG|nr:hypothetical protein HK099_008092 [Clydaea vesicula]
MKRDQSSLYNEATQPNEYEMRDNKKVRFFQGDQPPSLFNFNQSQLNQASLNFDFHFNQTPQLDNHDRELLEKLIKFLDLPYTYKETVIRLINSLASSTAIKKPHENHATITAAIFHTTYQSYLLQNSVSQDELPSFNQQLVNLLIVYKKNANLLTLSNCAFLVNLPKIFYTKILDSFTKIQKNSDNNLNQVSISAERYFNKLTYLTEILKKFGTLYQFFEKMFRIFCFKKFKSPDITEVELDFNQCVFRYCWTLIVFSLELNSVIEKNWCNYGRALCFQIVRFVSGCLTSNQQTSQGVHDLLKLPGNPDSVFGNAWWGVHSQFWLEILKKYPMFEGITVEDLSLAKQNLFKTIILLERSNFFLNTQRTYSEECEMPIFEHSFDVKLQGYFRTNYNGLTHLLDLIYLKSNKRDVLVIPSTNDSDRPLQEKVNFDVDVRVFLTEESSCAFSTTRGRVFKTPFKSKSNATTSRKLVSALKKYSGENNLMLSTPLSVKSVLSSRPKLNEFDLKSLREATIRSIAAEYPSIYHYSESFYKIYEGNELKFREAAATFPSIEEDYKAFRENFSTKDNSIQYQKFSENSCRMSNRFLIMLISQYLRRTRNVTIPVLLKDIQFRRCLLLISAEFIRSVFCSLITFEELLQVTKPNYLELLMLIDLILTCCGNYMDKYTVCRYIEIQERILESEIFKDNAIYEVFDFNKEELKTNRKNLVLNNVI